MVLLYYIKCFVLYVDNLHRHKMRNIRSSIPSIPRFLEKIRRNPNNTKLGIKTVRSW